MRRISLLEFFPLRIMAWQILWSFLLVAGHGVEVTSEVELILAVSSSCYLRNIKDTRELCFVLK